MGEKRRHHTFRSCPLWAKKSPLYPCYILAIGLHIPMFWLFDKFFCKKNKFFYSKICTVKKKALPLHSLLGNDQKSEQK